MSVLKLSTEWFCLSMRQLAIQKLKAISFEKQWSPVKSIKLGRKYHVQHWVISGYKTLLTRHDGISDDEAGDVGLRASLRIMRMREYPYFMDYLDAEMRKVFKDELASIEAENKAFYTSPHIRYPFASLRRSSQ